MTIDFSFKQAQEALPKLRDNICELIWALETPGVKSHHLPLVAWWDNRLYCTKSYVGRGMHCLAWYIEGAEQQSTRLNTALICTIKNISECVEPILRYYETHYVENYIRFLHSHLSLNVNTIEEVSHVLEKCSAAVFKLAIFLTDVRYQKTIEPIVHFLPVDQSCQKLCSRLIQAQCLMNVEGILAQSIPLPILAKLGYESLKDPEKLELRAWLDQLNHHKNRLTVREFEEALKEMIRIIQLEGSYPLTFDQLIIQLDALACPLLLEKDKECMEEVRKIKPYSTLYLNGKVLKLGAKLASRKSCAQDGHQVFLLEKQNHQVLKTGQNRLLFKILRARLEQEKKQVQQLHQEKGDQDVETGEWHVKIEEIDETGKYALLERMETSLAHYNWKSQKEPLEEKEEHIVEILAKRLNLMCRKNLAPKHLTLENLYVDFEGHVKFLGLLELEEASYDQLEAFCESIPSPLIQRVLAIDSELVNHPIALYYREEVEDALLHGKAKKSPPPIDFWRDSYGPRRDGLVQEALKLRERCFAEVEAYYQTQDDYEHERDAGPLQKKVAEELANVYKEQVIFPGILPSTYLEQILLKRFQDRS